MLVFTNGGVMVQIFLYQDEFMGLVNVCGTVNKVNLATPVISVK